MSAMGRQATFSQMEPLGDAGQVVWRVWSAVLALIGQQAGNLHVTTNNNGRLSARCLSPFWLRSDQIA